MEENQFKIPDKLPFQGEDSRWERHMWQKRGMYAFVSWKWVIPFVEWINGRTVLEVMSGAGYIAYALRQKGVNIRATDRKHWHHGAALNGHRWPYLTEVETLSANNAIKRYGKSSDVLIISWPYTDNSAYYAIKGFHATNPQGLVVFAGSYSGYTANELFFQHFKLIEEDDFNWKVQSEFETWRGSNDSIYLGRYSPKVISD